MPKWGKTLEREDREAFGLEEFKRTCLEVRKHAQADERDVWGAYLATLDRLASEGRRGMPAVGRREFTRQLERDGLSRKRSNGRTVWTGLHLRELARADALVMLAMKREEAQTMREAEEAKAARLAWRDGLVVADARGWVAMRALGEAWQQHWGSSPDDNRSTLADLFLGPGHKATERDGVRGITGWRLTGA